MPADNFLYFSKAATGSMLTTAGTQPEGETADHWFATSGSPAKGTFSNKTSALEISSFSFGVAQAETSASSTGGASAGKVKFEEFSIERNVDQASCPLFNACTSGAHFPSVMLAVRKAGGSPLLYLQYCFRQVFVTGINWSGGGGEEGFKETVKFKFGAMGIRYIQQTATGGEGTKMEAAWNTTNNTATLTVTGLPDESTPYIDKASQG
jgi:type VI protein secretion system component Hcp